MILPLLTMLAFQAPMLENEAVLVHMAVDKPHSKSALHHHELDRVMIYLDNGRMRIANADGKIENQTWKAKQVAWSPAGGDHTSENVGDQVLRIIEIELKRGAPAAKPFAISGMDPVKVDPKRFHVELENDKVRVFRGTYRPNEVGKMHEHLHDRVVAYLTTGQITVTTPDGKEEAKQLTANTVSWGVPTKHQEKIGNAPVEMVVVEVKNR
jgi:mannose-6-phosphate isomerase-like protein (cupin superfamily)/quercetin dioxygenase-like cupin family protein